MIQGDLERISPVKINCDCCVEGYTVMPPEPGAVKCSWESWKWIKKLIFSVGQKFFLHLDGENMSCSVMD